MIDTEFEGGNADAGKKLLDEAFKRDVTPAVSHPEAKRVIEARAAAEAKKKDEERRAKLSPVDQLKEAKWDDLVPAGSLYSEFNGNLVAAEAKYKGKTIMVEGEVESVDRGGSGSVQIYLSYRRGLRGVRCALSSAGAKSEDLKNLQPGSWIKVRGHCDGKAPSGLVDMSDCVFLLVNR